MSRLLRRLIAAMILGVFVYAAFALWRGVHEIGESLARFSWSAFAVACMLAFGNYLTRFLKWEYYLARLGIRGIPKLDSLLTFLSGLVLTVTGRTPHRRARDRHPDCRRKCRLLGRTGLGGSRIDLGVRDTRGHQLR